MKTCPYCKSEIHEKASVCPHCGKQMFGVGSMILIGVGMAGCGMWFLWIPLIGFPVVGFGLLLFVFGVIGLLAKIIKGIAKAASKNKADK